MGGVVINLFKMKTLNRIFYRVSKPFNNSKGSTLTRVFGSIMSVFLVVIFLSWFVMKGSEIFVKAQANSICNRFVDVIAENGKINAAMQTELYKDFNKLKFFTGDYKVKFLVYDYSNPGAKVSLGTSTNGSSIPETTIARGKIVQVAFTCSETALDKVSKLFKGSTASVGLSASSSMKVD